MSKINLDSSSRNPSCAELLRAVGDETRLAVLEQLIEGPKFVGELNDSLQIEQSLLSHHLKILREIGLVTSERCGKGRRYQLTCIASESEGARSLNLGCCHISF